MATLTATQLDSLKSLLDRREANLQAALREERARSSGEHYIDLVGSVADVGDEAVADVLTDIDNAAVGRHLDELDDIEATRKRMANGNYGVCIDCGQGVGYLRLVAYPTAKRCSLCQGMHERTYAEPSRPSL